MVTLNGGASFDPSNAFASLAFSWYQTSGPVVDLTGAEAARATFVPTIPGMYKFELVVGAGVRESVPTRISIVVPKLGDINLDGVVDSNDLNLILAALNKPANGPNDLRDLNGDGKIDALDSRKLITLCTRPRCAVQ